MIANSRKNKTRARFLKDQAQRLRSKAKQSHILLFVSVRKKGIDLLHSIYGKNGKNKMCSRLTTRMIYIMLC
jgi:hypothetical protein